MSSSQVSVSPDVAVSQQGHYAGAVTRLVGYVIDQFLATALFAAAAAAVVYLFSVVTYREIDTTGTRISVVVAYLLWLFLYYAYPWSTSGKTPGMAVVGIRVVRRDGSHASARNGVVRTLVFPLSFLLFGLGFIGILIGREHRALHDVIAGTAVVYAWDARGARWRFLARLRSGDPDDWDPLESDPSTGVPPG